MKKRLRQVIVATLIMTCVLQLCVIPNTSAEVTTSKYTTVDEIELLNNLGFVSKSNGPKKGEDIVTRAQFASILGYLRGFDSNVVYSGTNFMDISEKHWCASQIYSLYNTGLINGTSINTFSPNAPVTYSQAVKCLVSLLGYDAVAKQEGGYPNGYLTVANELGIAVISETEELNYATLAKLVVKAMDAEMMESNAVGNGVSLTTSEGLTPLGVYNDIYHEVGVVTDNGLTSLTGGTAFGGKAVVIGNQILDAGNTDIREYLGYRVKYYYKNADDGATLLFVLPYNTDVITLEDEDIDFDNPDYSFKNIYYTLNGKEKHCKIDDFVDVIYNGKAYTEYDPDSYDFTLTDEYLKVINDAGTKVFYRLGTKIEHWSKKYWSIVPADFHKWAVICEHIIRHYTLGWANGFHYDIEYWEIWNEPDGIKPNGDQPNWSGTPEQFYELYNIASRHLKKCFPNLKIGGPALSWIKHEEWLDDFLASLTADNDRAPLDFFSWHSYQEEPQKVIATSHFVRRKLDEAGFTETETILNEWNYLENWTDKFVSTIQSIISMRGAAFTSAVMALSQKNPIDMLMYYDARPCVFNGMFDFYSLKPLKGYYPFYMFSEIYDIKNEVESATSSEDIYVVAAADENRKSAMVTYYSLDKSATEKEVTFDLGENSDGEWQIEILDDEKTMEKQTISVKENKFVWIMKPSTVLFVRKRG